eukprot:6205772-Pleurochrysis_carterae.AAC.1
MSDLELCVGIDVHGNRITSDTHQLHRSKLCANPPVDQTVIEERNDLKSKRGMPSNANRKCICYI